MRHPRAWTALFLAVTAVLGLGSARAGDGDASITLGTVPEPPVYVTNPGGAVTIAWEVEGYQSTTPLRVHYILKDPLHAIVEEQDYAGSTGLIVSRDWTVPAGAAAGTYQVRIEYYTQQWGLEATAEVLFWVGEPTTPVEKSTWGRIKAWLGL